MLEENDSRSRHIQDSCYNNRGIARLDSQEKLDPITYSIENYNLAIEESGMHLKKIHSEDIQQVKEAFYFFIHLFTFTSIEIKFLEPEFITNLFCIVLRFNTPELHFLFGHLIEVYYNHKIKPNEEIINYAIGQILSIQIPLNTQSIDFLYHFLAFFANIAENCVFFFDHQQNYLQNIILFIGYNAQIDVAISFFICIILENITFQDFTVNHLIYIEQVLRTLFQSPNIINCDLLINITGIAEKFITFGVEIVESFPSNDGLFVLEAISTLWGIHPDANMNLFGLLTNVDSEELIDLAFGENGMNILMISIQSFDDTSSSALRLYAHLISINYIKDSESQIPNIMEVIINNSDYSYNVLISAGDCLCQVAKVDPSMFQQGFVSPIEVDADENPTSMDNFGHTFAFLLSLNEKDLQYEVIDALYKIGVFMYKQNLKHEFCETCDLFKISQVIEGIMYCDDDKLAAKATVFTESFYGSFTISD